MIEHLATMICKGQISYEDAIEKHPELREELDHRLGNIKIERRLYETDNSHSRIRTRHRVR